MFLTDTPAMSGMTTRFAPSPTGYLHLGHAASALELWRAAEEAGGTVLLRIEDIDQTRCKPEYEQAILEDLAWLGLSWPQPVRRQSDHFDDYIAALQPLAAQGLIYRCFKSRTEIEADIARAPHGAPVYLGPEDPLPLDEEIEKLENGEAFSWRLSLRAAREALGPRWDELGWEEEGRGWIRATPEKLGDVILARKDTPTSYHFACTHDDALQGVTHVVRGEDLFESTHIHVLLQALMGWPTPCYRHHGLKTGPDGKRFAKRDRSKNLRALRAEGMTPEEIRRLARL